MCKCVLQFLRPIRCSLTCCCRMQVLPWVPEQVGSAFTYLVAWWILQPKTAPCPDCLCYCAHPTCEHCPECPIAAVAFDWQFTKGLVATTLVLVALTSFVLGLCFCFANLCCYSRTRKMSPSKSSPKLPPLREEIPL